MMKENFPLFFKNDDVYSSSSEYADLSESDSSCKPNVERKSKDFPNVFNLCSLNENDILSEDQFNQMQDEILKAGQKLEPPIQAYVQNHKKSSSFLPIHNLFDLFKRELKMNLIIRQHLIKERASKQEIINKFNQLESQKNEFFQKLSQKANQKITNFNDVTNLFDQHNESKTEQKTNFISKELTNLKEKNEKLSQQNKLIQDSLNNKEMEKSIEMAQLLSTIQNSKQQISKFEIQFKQQNFQISQLKSKIEKKKQKNILLKNSISELNSLHEAQLKNLNEKVLSYEKVLNDSNIEKENLKREKEEQKEKIEKCANEIDLLKNSINKIEDIEKDNFSIKQKNKELNQQLKECLNKIQDDEIVYKKASKILIRMKKKNKYFRKVIKELNSQINAKDEEKEKNDQNVIKLNSKINKLQKIHQMEIELIKAQHLEQSKQTNDKLLILEDKFYSIQKNYSFCAEENKRLQYQLKQSSKDINRLESENARLYAKLEKIAYLNESNVIGKEGEEEEEEIYS